MAPKRKKKKSRKKKRRAIQNPIKVAKKKGQLRKLDLEIKVRKKALKRTQALSRKTTSVAKRAVKSTRSQGVKLHKVEKKRKKVSRRSTKLF